MKNIPIKLTGKLLEIMEGHLLGDGGVYKPKSYVNCKFSITSIHENYVKHIAKNLELLRPSKPLKWNNKIIYKGEERVYTAYSLWTKSLIRHEFRNKWYPGGIKVIPKDLKLTPTICLYWYLDDGCLSKSRGAITIATCSFTEKNLKETIFPQLKQILNDKNNKIKIYTCKVNDYKPEIYIPRRYTKRFLEYIGKCPIGEFQYKWAIKPYKRKGYDYL